MVGTSQQTYVARERLQTLERYSYGTDCACGRSKTRLAMLLVLQLSLR